MGFVNHGGLGVTIEPTGHCNGLVAGVIGQGGGDVGVTLPGVTNELLCIFAGRAVVTAPEAHQFVMCHGVEILDFAVHGPSPLLISTLAERRFTNWKPRGVWLLLLPCSVPSSVLGSSSKWR